MKHSNALPFSRFDPPSMSPAICTLDPWEELTGEQQDRVLQQFSNQIAT